MLLRVLVFHPLYEMGMNRNTSCSEFLGERKGGILSDYEAHWNTSLRPESLQIDADDAFGKQLQ